jgi:hypothetical protein
MKIAGFEMSSWLGVPRLFKSSSKVSPLVFTNVALVVVIVGMVSWYGWTQFQAKTTAPTEVDVAKVMKQVGKHILLPDEQPTLATVTDVEKVKQQPFFARAQNGDQVLLFAQAKKAYLFRPVSDQLVEVAPLNLGETPSNSAPDATTQSTQNTVSKPKVALFNGSFVVGLTGKVEAKIIDSGLEVDVVDKANAEKRPIENSVIVPLKPTVEAQANELAKLLGISVGKLPEGEPQPPNVDLAIYLASGSGSAQ